MGTVPGVEERFPNVRNGSQVLKNGSRERGTIPKCQGTVLKVEERFPRLRKGSQGCRIGKEEVGMVEVAAERLSSVE
jgi:DNA replicative helicase MCM subunit Mcm2 (Cdc46/Mcm family)